jgi:DNA-binding MarR family transcriptional regulator
VDLEEELLTEMERVFRLARLTLRETPLPLPVRGLELRVMFLVHREGAQHPSRLADRLGVTRAVVSAVIRRLTDLGLVTSHVSPDDRRRHLVALTETATRFMAELRDRRREALRTLLGSLTLEERDEMLTLFRKIRAPS